MQVLNFGSLNIDHVYTVGHFVAAGETLAALDYKINAGGKGLNQSVALARAGVKTFHAGMIGRDGIFLKEVLESAGVNTEHTVVGELPSGHAVIQLERDSAQNSILLYSGSNMSIPQDFMCSVLDSVPQGSWILLQNEINDIPFLICEAKKRKLHVAINPAPCTDAVKDYPLELCDLIMVNLIEASQLTGVENAPSVAAEMLAEKFPDSEIVITLGGDGALYRFKSEEIFVPAFPVEAVDTTGAGDTFTGFFLAAKLRGMGAEQAMKYASFAASVAVSRHGAAASIPSASEVFPADQNA